MEFVSDTKFTKVASGIEISESVEALFIVLFYYLISG
jgi:hypothetical protein